ncbi:MAG: cytochrome c3 family protein [bacterium]
MQRLRVAIGLVAVALMAGAAVAGPYDFGDPETGFIDGTAHDFRGELSDGSTNTPNNRICQPCHTPHGAILNPDGSPVGPLWNQTLSSQTFTRKDWHTGAQEDVELGKESKLCLSCHDGTVAIPAYGNQKITGGAQIGKGGNLSGDHPIGVNYAEAISSHAFIYENPDDVADFLSPEGNIECTSCHHAHGGSDGKFLVTTNAESQLCRECHRF